MRRDGWVETWSYSRIGNCRADARTRPQRAMTRGCCRPRRPSPSSTILDDLDYVRKDQAETAVLFEFLADDEVCVGDFRFYSGKRASAMASRLV